MTDLAEQIAERNRHAHPTDPNGYVDELDLPIFLNRPDYIVARILKKNYSEYSVGESDLLHTRNGRDLWLGHVQLKQNQDTLYRLSGVNQVISSWLMSQTYALLLKHVSRLDYSALVITESLYWDKETGELKQPTEEMLTITPVRRKYVGSR